ncbi:MAG: hypothetical protein J2P25_17450 [Nocardiopsaceae bacterium]|nr:hypothetical protein [Nocardiopsaceae bacterium]
MRFFNKSGPCDPERHYMLPPEPRLPRARHLVEEGLYFVVHAPRQTGKTTSLTALARDITAGGERAAVLFSCERARTHSSDIGAAGREILQAITEAAQWQELPEECQPPRWPDAPPGSLLRAGLQAWARACPRPLVLFFDEFDALTGKVLISAASQLRDGYQSRPANFPASVALCGLRDIRDYRVAAGQNPEPSGSRTSPFNIIDESFRMTNFTPEQVAELYGQHTAETGQEFSDAAIDRAVEYSQGQPWLVNALAREITDNMGITDTITPAHVDTAKERLILARATHIEYLGDRLSEPRVKKIIEPLLAGRFVTSDPAFDDDLAYVRDLGLIGQGEPIAIANPVYNEVIARTLAYRTASQITLPPVSFLLPDGRLDVMELLRQFASFWKQNGEILIQGEAYHEVAPQLVFMAYLQRVVNGGGQVAREYGIGRGRIDLIITKPYTDAEGKAAVQHEVIELKVRRQGERNPLKGALAQLDEYLSRLGLDAGTLIIFDRRPSVIRKRPAPETASHQTPEGREITVLTA